MSFFLIKFMQSFDGIEFDGESLDPKARPLPEWKDAPGRKGKEKIWPWSHLTLYVKVSVKRLEVLERWEWMTDSFLYYRAVCG